MTARIGKWRWEFKRGQVVRVGDAVVRILETHTGSVVLGIEAPVDIAVLRDDAVKKVAS